MSDCDTCDGDGYGEDSGGMGGRETCGACKGQANEERK